MADKLFFSVCKTWRACAVQGSFLHSKRPYWPLAPYNMTFLWPKKSIEIFLSKGEHFACLFGIWNVVCQILHVIPSSHFLKKTECGWLHVLAGHVRLDLALFHAKITGASVLNFTERPSCVAFLLCSKNFNLLVTNQGYAFRFRSGSKNVSLRKALKSMCIDTRWSANARQVKRKSYPHVSHVWKLQIRLQLRLHCAQRLGKLRPCQTSRINFKWCAKLGPFFLWLLPKLKWIVYKI